jgi:hypothetical protein
MTAASELSHHPHIRNTTFNKDSGPVLALVSLILIAGGLLLTLLVLIAGAVDHNPANKFYFLQADTSGIPGAAASTRWTFWNACGVTDGHNMCPKVHPAYAFDPPRNFGSEKGVPKQFVGYARKKLPLQRLYVVAV